MKQKDYALILVIVFVSGIVSFIISGKIFVTPENRQQKVQTVDVIDSNFQKPSEKYFNDKSINPAQLVFIGDTSNTNPFNAAKP